MNTMTCSECGVEIPEGLQVVAWGPADQPASVCFICLACSEKYEDITEEVTGRKP